MADKIIHGTQVCGERHSQAKLTAAMVHYIRSSDETNDTLAMMMGVHP